MQVNVLEIALYLAILSSGIEWRREEYLMGAPNSESMESAGRAIGEA
jgi:hypothetical protein